MFIASAQLVLKQTDKARNLHYNPKMSIGGILPPPRVRETVQIKSHNL